MNAVRSSNENDCILHVHVYTFTPTVTQHEYTMHAQIFQLRKNALILMRAHTDTSLY